MAHLGLIRTGIGSSSAFWGLYNGRTFFLASMWKKVFINTKSHMGNTKSNFLFLHYKYLVVIGWVKKSKFDFLLKTTFSG